eukprot:jgi/Tetstr1/436487/TSEL_025315.t1
MGCTSSKSGAMAVAVHEPALDNSTDPSSHSKAPTSKAENATMESAQSDPSEQVDVHKSSTAQDAQSSEVADPTTAETDRSSKQVQSDSGELVDGELQESPAALSREAQIAPMAEDVVSAEQMEVQDATLTVDLKAPAIPEAPTTGNANCAAVHGSVEQVEAQDTLLAGDLERPTAQEPRSHEDDTSSWKAAEDVPTEQDSSQIQPWDLPPLSAAGMERLFELLPGSSSSISSLQTVPEHASYRGVALNDVMKLGRAEEALVREGLLPEGCTTKRVVELVVKPLTAHAKCSMLSLPWATYGTPSVFVSHTWHRPFWELIRCLQRRFEGEEEGMVVWLDVFAFNQHLSFKEMEDDLNTLANTVEHTTQRTVVVMDPTGICFKRVWCQLEMFTAATCGEEGDRVGKLEILPYLMLDHLVDGFRTVIDLLYSIDVATAEAQEESDKDRILAQIVAKVGSLPRFNSILKERLAIGVADMAELLPEENEERNAAVYNAASMMRAGGLLEEAVRLFRAAVMFAEQQDGEGAVTTAEYKSGLAIALDDLGEWEEAEEMYREVLATRQAKLGEDHQDTANTQNNLANLLDGQGRREEAEVLYRAALATREAKLGADHVKTADTQSHLAALLKAQGLREEPELLYRAALATHEAKLGANHVSTAGTQNGLASLLQLQGRQTEAEALYRAALSTKEAKLGADHASTAGTRGDLGILLQTQGRHVEAEELYRAALETYVAKLGANHVSTAIAQNNLAFLLTSLGQQQEAEALCRAALATQEVKLGVDHVDTANTQDTLACLLHAQGNEEEAEAVFRLALATHEAKLGVDHVTTAETKNNLAGLLAAQKRAIEAEALYRSALAAREAFLGADHPDTAATRGALEALLVAC